MKLQIKLRYQLPFSQYPADFQTQFSGSDKAHASLPEGSAKQIVMQAQAWKPVRALLPFTSWMWVGPVRQSNTSLTPFPAPHYPQCFTRYQPLPLPSLTQKKKKRGETSTPTAHHISSVTGDCLRQTACSSTSWGSCPVPAQRFQTMMDLLWGTLYIVLLSPAQGFDRPNPTDLKRSAKNLHLRWYRCRPITQEEYISFYRVNLFVAEQDNFEIKIKPPQSNQSKFHIQAPRSAWLLAWTVQGTAVCVS